ncbi:MAG: 23S rRNA (guanosine(2251)-2'-O)-methyltransferase RlmB [Deltaproteobacteria bacterium]|nr:23S rRNA (guanosine(2251)-2'-O)-methyltransferase RlmB [Deltaproteobacteria bacterium]
MKRIVAGPRAVSEALAAHASELAVVVVDAVVASKSPIREIVAQAASRKVATDHVSRDELDALAKGLRHQGILAVGGDYPYVDLDALLAPPAPRSPRPPSKGPSPGKAEGDAQPSREDGHAPSERAPLIVALDEVTDPRNLGAIVRSAVAFGALGIVLTRDRCATVTPAAVRASAGATEHARIARVTNLARTLETLAEQGMLVVGLDAVGTADIGDVAPPPEGVVLVVGSEGRGLRRLTRERCGTLARIPMAGPIASLNAASAATVALYALARGRVAPRDEAPRQADDRRPERREPGSDR